MGRFPSGLTGSALRAFADQALYSLSNLVLTLALAHRLGLRDYGIFAVIMTSSFIAIGSLRAVTTERAGLEIRAEARTVSPLRIVYRLGALFPGLGVLSALSLAAAVVARPSPLVLTLMLVPLIALVDLVHSALVLSGWYSTAVPANLIWVAAVGMTVLWSRNAGATLAGWTVGALLALGWMTLGVWRAEGRRPAADHRREGRVTPASIRRWPILLDHLGPRVLNQIAFFGLAAVGGFSQVGAFRLAQTFVGPLDLLMIASMPLGVASLAGTRADGVAEREMLQRLEITLASLAGTLLVVGSVAVIVNPWSLLRPSTVPLASILPTYVILGIRSLSGVAAVSARIRARQRDASLDLARNEMSGALLSLVLMASAAVLLGSVDATLLAAVLAIGTLLVVQRQRALDRPDARLGLVGGV
jgi:hypothetical protein